ncbi:MAG: RHS repeat-associated core domain-containing protein [Bacteroidia bacterium]
MYAVGLLQIIFDQQPQPLIESYINGGSSFIGDLSQMDYMTFSDLYDNFFPFPGPCSPGDIPCMVMHLQGIPAADNANFLTLQPVYLEAAKHVIYNIESQGAGSTFFSYINAAYDLSIVVSWMNAAHGDCGMYGLLLSWNRDAIEAALSSYANLESLLTLLYDEDNADFLSIIVDQLEAVYRSTIASLYDLEDVLSHIASHYDQATADAVLAAITTHTDALTDFFRISEHPMYGSSRLGIARSDEAIYWHNVSGPDGTGELQVDLENAYRLVGKKHYELSNHLGNVLTVITDKKLAVEDALGAIAYYKADILSAQDYYPFGMVMTRRSFSSPTYRYGFNGQEKDDEISGAGNSYTAEYWQYDSRLGRRWNIDPLTYPWQGSYVTFNNNPIIFVDPLGLFGTRKEAKDYKKSNDVKGRIHKNDDGNYSIDNKKEHWSIYEDEDLGIQKAALFFERRPDNKNFTPWELGVEWLTGTGARSRTFIEGDKITGMYRNHEHVQQTKNKIAKQLNKRIDQLPIEGQNPYNLSGIEGVGKYLKDYSTLATAGLTGNLIYTYLGSHSLQYTISDVDIENRIAIVTFLVHNTSTIQSATRPPVIGYQELS